ncbi:phosphate acyltransferase [Litoreibacter halocynthiae]|uniref:phosphate acyltransferase n=1 Tax=Litoreibacter halocynthiae TaxID=1242689 RepID=UPI002491A39F|nr:phosphate acyltransferase [Litoreibacter halocynthiae]
MTSQRSFADLYALAINQGTQGLSVAGGDDPEVMKAIVAALRDGLVGRVAVTGNAQVIKESLPEDLLAKTEIIEATGAVECATLAVEAVRTGNAGILMKGHVDSTSYLRAIVNRDTGIRAGGVLSNVTIAEMPSYPKFLAATDNGIIPAPTLAQKRQIILNTAPLFRGLGVDCVKVAALAATEKVTVGNPATEDAARLATESSEGEFPGFIIEGPFGYDVAVSKAAAKAKKLSASQVAGEADLLLFPTIDAANAVAKSWKFHGQAQTGSIVLGAQVPVLLNSRSDSVERRINALLLALAVSNGEKP